MREIPVFLECEAVSQNSFFKKYCARFTFVFQLKLSVLTTRRGLNCKNSELLSSTVIVVQIMKFVCVIVLKEQIQGQASLKWGFRKF